MGGAEYVAALESELGVGPWAHPYGFDADGLVAEVRVAHERALRSAGALFPPLVEREAAARAEAERRWPYMFAVGGASC